MTFLDAVGLGAATLVTLIIFGGAIVVVNELLRRMLG